MADVESIQKELEEVKKRLATVIAKDRAPVEPKVIFAPRERKLQKFSGQKDDRSVEEFIEETELLLKSRPTQDEEKVDFIISHLEGPAKEELRYRTASDKKTPGAVLKILKDVFGERSTLSELLSDFYQCRQKEKQSLQDYSHDLMNKLDKIHKKDPKAIKDRDVAIRNQFAENVRGPWLRRDLKKRIRDHPDLTFTDIREEATLLIQDEDSDQQQVDQYKDDIDVPVYASQGKSGENSDLSKVLADLTSELESIKTEVQTLKREKQQKQQRKFTKVDKDFICYNCGKPGHIKRNCRSQSRDLNKDNLLQRADQWVERKN